ncbi:MAG: DUF58 domain-containing protein [Pseudomonadota bacterium]
MARSPARSLRRWWLARLPASAEHLLTHRNLYLLPTRSGAMLGLTLLLLLVGSINYQLNLGYLLTFMIAGSLFAGMHLGHANLRGIRLHASVTGDAFAGQACPARVHLQAPGRRTRWALALRWDRPGAQPVTTDLPGGERVSVTLPLVFATRGRHALPALGIETRYPLGAMRIWSWWRPAGTVCVYPAPEPDPPPLPPAAAPAAADGAPPPAPATPPAAPPDMAPDAVRPYRAGDAPSRILWKKAARHDGDPTGWLVRDSSSAAPPAVLWLDEATCGLRDREARRSRLCAWVLAADARGLRYGLRLAGRSIEPDTGAEHRRRCLELLACD